MIHGPFDSDEEPQAAELPSPAPSGFSDFDTEQLLAEASRTWDALSSDLKSLWKARR